MTKKQQYKLTMLLLIVAGCKSSPKVEEQIPPVVLQKVPDRLELPALKHGEKIIEKKGYALVFDKSHRLAKWTAYKLTKEQVENKAVSRDDKFEVDPEVEGSAMPNDYKHSGYDRGHLVPAADLVWSFETMRASFFMTNMAPQKPKLNRQLWKNVETKVREWAKKFGEVFVVSGPVLRDKLPKLKSGISIPEKYFKVVLEKQEPEVTAIGFVMPQEYRENDWKKYARSVDDVEKEVGLDFYSSLEDVVEEKVEIGVKNGWQ